MNIKSILKKSGTLVKIHSAIRDLIEKNRTHPCHTKHDYFQSLFARNPNIESLTFEKGLTKGSFKDIEYVLKVNPKNLIETCVYRNGIWESHIIHLISSYINRANGAVIDVGANIGATSIPLAKCYPDINFYLFEPHPLVFEDLCNNISYNKLDNIKAYNQAITNAHCQTMPFYAQKNTINLGQSSFKKNHDIEDHDIINVECTSIDSVFENIKEPVKLIKIDTQGSELQVLLSARNSIRKNRPVIIFEFENEYFEDPADEKETKKQLINLFHEENYDLFMIPVGSPYLPGVNLSSYFNGEIIALPKANTSGSMLSYSPHDADTGAIN